MSTFELRANEVPQSQQALAGTTVVFQFRYVVGILNLRENKES